MMTTLLIGFAFLVLASSLGFQASPGRPIAYPFAFGAFALFLAVGPFALRIVALATAVGLVVRWLRHRRRASDRSGPSGLVLIAVAVSLGILGGAAVARMVHAAYPLPVRGTRALVDYLIVQGVAYLTFVVGKELGRALGDGLFRRERTRTRGVVTIYVAGFVLGAPIQLAAHALYDDAQPLPWTIALGWTLLINALLGRQLERMRRQNELLDKLRRQRRLAAIGEVTARVLHHTRHQMGLVGMIAHQIAAHLDSFPDATANPIRSELTKLAAVREDLQQALTGDLGGSAPPDSDDGAAYRSYESLIRTQTALLQPLAAERAVDVRVEVAADVLARIGPNRPVKLAQAFLNVLENAISAATRRVTVALGREGSAVVITVSDDGPGMEPARLARATEPFFTTKEGGSGMGLAITRAVVEEEEGELALDNGPSGGLVVQMRMPVLSTRSRSARAAPPDEFDREPREPGGSASRGS
jgi:signal transduction histidine kinase